MALIRTGSNGSLGALNITYFNNKKASNEEPLIYTCLSDSDILFSFGCANMASLTINLTTSGSGSINAIVTPASSSNGNAGIYEITGLHTGDTITFKQGQVGNLGITGVFAEYTNLDSM